MKLSIVILNYKTRELLRQCLRGLQGPALSFSYEIIVVDNNSGDGSVDMVKERFPHVLVISAPTNGGFARGMNLGLKRAQGEYLLLLNTDIIILDDALERMIQFLDKELSVGLLGPKLLNPDRSVQYSCMQFPAWYTPVFRRTPLGATSFGEKHLKDYLLKDWDHASNKEVDWLLGGFMIVRAKALAEVGYFDERFFLYMEDVDLCRRFWEKRWKVVYFSDAQIIHYHKRESASSPGLKGVFSYPTRVHIKSFLQYLKKYKGKSSPHLAQ